MEAGQLFCGAMENHTEPRVEGVDQRLEETSCGWRLWISSGCFTCTVSECVCSTVCIARHWIVDHVAHAIILYLERMCRVACWSC